MGDELFLASIKKLLEQNLNVGELIGLAENFKQAGRSDLVVQLYTLWLRCNPENPFRHVIHFNKAVVQSDSGDLAGAKAALEEAIAIHPDFYPPYINLGTLIERMGDAHGAILLWSKVGERLPQITGSSVQYKLTALKQMGRVFETHHLSANAEAVLQQSLDIDPDQPDVMQHYIALRLAQCEWPVVVPWEGVERKMLMRGIGPLSMAIYTDDPMLQLASAWNYNQRVIGYPTHDFQDRHKARRTQPHEGRLRIGYVSSDLRNHAVGFIMAEIFELHDREKFEIFAYYCGPVYEDALQERIRANIDHWLNINEMNDEAVALRMIEDGIDILVDVNGYTKDARTKVFAMKPAPVIINWLGYPGSMASPYHHYIIADEWIIPEDHEIYYTEKVLRLPCYQPNDRKRNVAPHRPTRHEAGLPEEGVVFCCFNGVQKFSRAAFNRWMQILHRVPGSVLWLLDAGEETNQRLRAYAAEQGVAPERLIFAPKKLTAEHLARFPLADLFLDTASYGAHVTASDSLWMGVPIVTITGRGFAARVCSSLNRAAGLPEMVCATPEEYVERAVTLGNDPAALAQVKKKLAENRDSCLLFDSALLIQHLESLFMQVWDEFLADALPRPDLTNLERYLEAGSDHDHEAVEMIGIGDYTSIYQAKFARWHRYHPLKEDQRLWTAADIARAAS